jgi:tetratricopeptide (TPR) repeat protein
MGKPQEAIGPLEMAVKWARTDADAMYKLGMAYAGAKDYTNAVNMFHGATTFVPDFLEAYQAMASAYDTMQKPVLAGYARGMVAYSQKDYKGALPILLQAAQGDPGFPPVFTGLGRTYEALNDLQNAKAAYEAAFKLDPNNFTAANGIERVTAALKK